MDGKVPLEQVRKWDLEDIATFCEILDMRQDYKTALGEHQHREANKK